LKIAIFTSNGLRHKFYANSLSEKTESLIICECKANTIVDIDHQKRNESFTERHFRLRYEAEMAFFQGNDTFRAPIVPMMYKDANTMTVVEIVKKFGPDAGFVFGSSILRDPLLSLIPKGKFINMHLGLSPYYRGAGTNFWPFVNNELEYVGASLLHLDAGIDTGDIIAHVRAPVSTDDNIHTLGCKVIVEAVNALMTILKRIENGDDLKRKHQWKVENERYYRKKDVTEEIIKKCYDNMNSGIVQRYAETGPKDIPLVPL